MLTREQNQPRHPIRVVAERTGLSLETLRAWERRYSAVVPHRTEGGQRLYSDADIEHLQLLRRVTQAGRSIGNVAMLPRDELRSLAVEDEAVRRPAPARPSAEAAGTRFVVAALAAIRRLDSPQLEAVMRHGMSVLGVMRFVEGVALPVLRELGDGWQRGDLSIAHEHLASAVIRRVLGEMVNNAADRRSAPVLVATTLPGQTHEFGALLAAVTAAATGWRVIYLGADLPIEDIAETARATGATVVAISLIYPVDDPRLPTELRRLREAVGPKVRLLAGGAAVEALHGLLDSLGYVTVAEIPELYAVLSEMERGVRVGVA